MSVPKQGLKGSRYWSTVQKQLVLYYFETSWYPLGRLLLAIASSTHICRASQSLLGISGYEYVSSLHFIPLDLPSLKKLVNLTLDILGYFPKFLTGKLSESKYAYWWLHSRRFFVYCISGEKTWRENKLQIWRCIKSFCKSLSKGWQTVNFVG